MQYIIPIIVVITVLVAFSFVWFNKSEPSERPQNEHEEFMQRVLKKIEENKPSDETHFYFKGKSACVVGKGNYLPLIPIILDGNERLRIKTKHGFESIIVLDQLEQAIYYPQLPKLDIVPETLKTKDSNNG